MAGKRVADWLRPLWLGRKILAVFARSFLPIVKSMINRDHQLKKIKHIQIRHFGIAIFGDLSLGILNFCFGVDWKLALK